MRGSAGQGEKSGKSAVLKAPMWCPFVLVVRVDRGQGRVEK